MLREKISIDIKGEKMIDIRLLTKEDLLSNEEELIFLMDRVLSENMDYTITREMCKRYYEDMKRFYDDGTAVLIGAFDGEKLVGFHWGYILDTPGGKRMHSYHGSVDPAYRSQGIGRRFWPVLEEEAKKRNVYTIEAMCTYANRIAVNFHLHYGFEIERLKVVKRLKNEEERPSQIGVTDVEKGRGG